MFYNNCFIFRYIRAITDYHTLWPGDLGALFALTGAIVAVYSWTSWWYFNTFNLCLYWRQTDKKYQETAEKLMAYTAGSIGLAAIIGPVIGGVMVARSKIDIIFISILFLITVLLIVKILEEPFVSTERGKFNFKDF